MMLSKRTFSPLEKGEKFVQIIKALQEHIIDGNVPPGTALPSERELARSLGVSRFSLREALRVAETQGLIEVRRGSLPRVSVPSTNAASEILALTLRRTKNTFLQLVVAREILESQVARLAARRISLSDMELMERTIQEMEKNSDDPVVCAQKDFDFHNILLEASDQVVFEIMLFSVSQLLRESIIKTLKLTGVDRVIKDHRLILTCLRKRLYYRFP